MTNQIHIAEDYQINIDGIKSDHLFSLVVRNDGWEASCFCNQSLGKYYQGLEGKKVDAVVINKETKEAKFEYNQYEITLVEIFLSKGSAVTVRVCAGPAEKTNQAHEAILTKLHQLERNLKSKT